MVPGLAARGTEERQLFLNTSEVCLQMTGESIHLRRAARLGRIAQSGERVECLLGCRGTLLDMRSETRSHVVDLSCLFREVVVLSDGDVPREIATGDCLKSLSETVQRTRYPVRHDDGMYRQKTEQDEDGGPSVAVGREENVLPVGRPQREGV